MIPKDDLMRYISIDAVPASHEIRLLHQGGFPVGTAVMELRSMRLNAIAAMQNEIRSVPVHSIDKSLSVFASALVPEMCIAANVDCKGVCRF